MNEQTLNQAEIEAMRFIKACQALRAAKKASKRTYDMHPRESGAVKRASMDLTRKLADVRQGR